MTSTSFTREISNLRPSKGDKKIDSLGKELDGSVGIKYSPIENIIENPTKTELERHVQALALYQSFLLDNEVANNLSYILNNVMKLSAYDEGFTALANHQFAIRDINLRGKIVKEIANMVFSIPIQDARLNLLSNFIEQITAHAIKVNQGILINLCQEILIFSIKSENYLQALHIWSKANRLEWARSEFWFCTAINSLPQIYKKDDFLFILNEIECPANAQSFESLAAVLKKSSEVSRLIPENTRFLETFKSDEPLKYLRNVSKCYLEIESRKWLGTQIRFGIDNFADFLEVLPYLVEWIGFTTADNLLNHLTLGNDDLLTVLVAFSIILNKIQQDNSSPSPIDRHLGAVKNCKAENIGIALEILTKHWDDFSVEQLRSMYNFLELHRYGHQNISLSLTQINGVIEHEIRIQKIQDLYATKKIKENLRHIVFDSVSDFVHTGDVDAWTDFEKLMQDRRLNPAYHKYLVQILLENQFFKIADDKLKTLGASLESAGLIYEADVFTFWLFFLRGIFVNPIPTIGRTLSLYCVDPDEAGKIIGYGHGLDKKRAHSLKARLVQMDPEEAEKLVKKLDTFIAKNPTRSFENKLRSIILDLPPKVIWIENCKSLSRNIKSELSKIKNRRY